MDGYQIDTFQGAVQVHIQKRMRTRELLRDSSFSILCIKRLWGAVGHFLGCRAQPAASPSARAFQPEPCVRRFRCKFTVKKLA